MHMQFYALFLCVVLPFDLLDSLYVGVLQIHFPVVLIHLRITADGNGRSVFEYRKQLVLPVLGNDRLDKYRRIPIGDTNIHRQFIAVFYFFCCGTEYTSQDGDSLIRRPNGTDRHRIGNNKAVPNQRFGSGNVKIHTPAPEDPFLDDADFSASLKKGGNTSQIGLILAVTGGRFCLLDSTGSSCRLPCRDLGRFFSEPCISGRFVIFIILCIISGLDDLDNSLNTKLTADDARQNFAGLCQIKKINSPLEERNMNLDRIGVFHDLIP